MRRLASLALLLVCLLIPAATAESADPDTVVLINGSRIQGELKVLRQGKLELSTIAMSTVYVEWVHVAQVMAGRYFEVETSDGAKYYGALLSSGPGQMTVAMEGHMEELALASIVGIRPIKQSFLDRLDGLLSLGASYTKSSGIGQGTLNVDVATRRPRFGVRTTLNTTVTTQEGERDSLRGTLTLEYSWFLPRRWLIPLTGKVDRNRDLGFDWRSSAGAGLGRRLVQTNRSYFAAGGGLLVNREAPVSGDHTTNIEGYVGADYSFYTYDTPKTNVGLSFEVLPSLSDLGRVRTDFSGGVSREVLKDFTIGFTLYDAYDSRPPTADARKNDFGFSLNVGWTF